MLDTIIFAKQKDFAFAAGFCAGKLCELSVTSQKVNAGDVVACKLQHALPNQKGAFVTLSGGERGYLQSGSLDEKFPDFISVLRPAYHDKQAFVTSKRSYLGRWLIYTPDILGVNLSRRLKNQGDFENLRMALMNKTGGWIVRSCAVGQDVDKILCEADFLQSLQTYPFGFSHYRALRDWEISPKAILWADDSSHQNIYELCKKSGWDDYANQIQIAQNILEIVDLDSQFNLLMESRVELTQFSWMSIEITEGLTVIDVNTGADFSPNALLKANLAAACEIPRQISLRGLGGVVIVDFAGNLDAKQREVILQKLKQNLNSINADIKGWGPTGQCHLVFQRLNSPIKAFFSNSILKA